MMEKDEKQSRGSISPLAVFCSFVLVFGIVLSVTSTLKPLKYSKAYVWYFGFAVEGVVFIVLLLVLLRKRFAGLLGLVLVFIYLFTAGFGAMLCEVNAMRLGRLKYYESKTITATIDGVDYEWDQKSVTYNSENLKYWDELQEESKYAIYVDGEKRNLGIYVSDKDENIYIEIYPGGTGMYLILEPTQ